jgi:hypothetical protein
MHAQSGHLAVPPPDAVKLPPGPNPVPLSPQLKQYDRGPNPFTHAHTTCKPQEQVKAETVALRRAVSCFPQPLKYSC